MRIWIAIALLGPASAHAGLLPETLGEFRGKSVPLASRTPEKALFAEYV